ncbi:MAG TPA: hypothetical protein VL974_08960 [Magnetospirillum sp.]|jgi:hypothetical protein|nr:hypothetical protein [Magnetospirillum sp.]
MIAALVCALAGVAGLIALAVAWGATPLLRGGLAAVIALHGAPFGCLLLLLIDHLIPQHWSLKLDRVIEASALTMPFVGLAFVPLLLGLASIWPWASVSPWPEGWPRREWLSGGFFAGRAVAFFLLWSLLAVLAATRTRGRTRPIMAAAGLIAWALTGALAGFDWQMSLEPPFRSTIFGLLFLENQTLTGLSFAVLATLALGGERSPRPGPLAAVLLAVVLLWSYLAFMQYLIVWSGNLPHEIVFYLHRLTPGWHWLLRAIAALLGGLAFLVLLPGYVRHNRWRVAWVAGFVLVMRLVETSWLILPAWTDADPLPLLLAYGAVLLALGGLWGAAFLSLLKRRSEVAHAGA